MMTTAHYRLTAAGQMAAIILLGLTAVLVFFGAVPQYRIRQHLVRAMDRYSTGTDTGLRGAQEELDAVMAEDERVPTALALRGRIGIEQGNTAIALDAYRKLEQALREQGRPTAGALNGIGCVLMLEAKQAGADRRAKLDDAYKEFASAIAQDRLTGDAHVNAAVCALHLGDLERAAGLLRDARNTRNLTYEALVSYYSAVGTLMAEASARGRATARAAADAFGDSDAGLSDPVAMVFRAAAELEKAALLERSARGVAEMKAGAAVARARLLSLATIPKAELWAYWAPVANAIQDYRDLLPGRERQLMAVVLSNSHGSQGDPDGALAWARRAAAEGEMSSEVLFYVGTALFQAAQAPKRAAERSRLETEATTHLLKALADARLPGQLRWRALTALAVAALHATPRDVADASRHLTDATAELAKLEKGPGIPDKAERGRFYRNLGILQYENGEVGASIESLRRSLELDPTQSGVAEFLAKLAEEPVLEGLGMAVGVSLPASLPVVTARVASSGPVPVRKEEVSMKVDGEAVAFVVCGPGNRVYALPRRSLAEGKHVLTVTVSPAGKKAVTVEKEFEVKYEYRRAPVVGG